ncbi:sialidase family protein [Nitrosovibrio tenuis]|uniref:BNR repeat-like domain-containing protein n=1 Tax=Nitrosovibrio tenuis TaxID=1233 RepID=A0A1H7IEI7_9PROT|nr:sialidase family protein [Nitrosovibrio tenuis]SEK60983.1 hypothetical protein SAMN05216387_102149 [Nitrosovibrio tenuis]
MVTKTAPTFDLFDQMRASDRERLRLPQPSNISSNTSNLYLAPLFFSDGWNGYRYWGIFTPFPSSDVQYENPCLVVSNDGWNWSVPAGVTNPLIPKPAVGNNMDTSLAQAPDGMTLYLIWSSQHDASGHSQVKVSESTNGISWSAPVSIVDLPESTGATANTLYTPCVWFNGTNWKLIVHNRATAGGALGGPAVVQVAATSGSSIYSGWGAFSAITMVQPLGRGWWHSHFQRVPDGRILGVCTDGNESGGDIWFAESLDDGATFRVRRVSTESGYYRSAICLTQDLAGSLGMSLYIGEINGGFQMLREDWKSGLEALSRSKAVTAMVTGAADSKFVFLDNYNRANGAVGTPVVGSAMTVDVGSLVIKTRQLSFGTVGNNRGLVTCPSVDYSVQATIVSGNNTWLLFRGADAANYYRWGVPGALGTGNVIQSIVAGNVGSLDRPVVGPDGVEAQLPAGSIMKVVCRGGRFRLYINGNFCEEIPDTLHALDGVKCGVSCGVFALPSAGVWDDYSVITC